MDIRVEDKNLVDHADWYTPITGSTAHVVEMDRITASYVNSKNYIENDIGPHGIEVPIWKTQGFATGYTAGIRYTYDTSSVLGTIVDNTKMYRFSIWVNRKDIGTNGLFYFGYNIRNGENVGNSIRVNDGLVSTNFYFVTQNFTQAATTLPENNWVLAVGYLLPSTYTGGTDANYYNKIYSTSGTILLTGGQNYKMSGDTTGVRLRCYTPYNETTWSGTTSWLYNPRIDLVDGTEPSISTLLSNEGMWRSVEKSYVKLEDKNLVDYTNWSGLTCGDVSGNGSFWGEYAEGDGTTNCRILDTDPWGNINPIWRCSSTGATTYGGVNSWDYQYIDCDPTKDYRFSCWFNKKTIITTKKGAFYFGCRATSGTTAQQIQNKNTGVLTNNPYFVYNHNIQNIEEDEWYLLVGYLYKAGTASGGTMNSAMYNLSGIKITGWTCSDFINNNIVTDLTIRITPIYNASGCTAYVAYPRIDLVDGTEPSIATLLTNEGMWRRINNNYINVDNTWKLAPEPETQLQIDRITADGGTIVDADYMNSMILYLKSENLYGGVSNSGCTILCDANFAIKKNLTGGTSKVYDISGNNNDLIQTTENNQPIWYSNSGSNSKAALDFDGSNDFLILSAVTLQSHQTLFTVNQCSTTKPMFIEHSINLNLYDGFYFYGTTNQRLYYKRGGVSHYEKGSASWAGTTFNILSTRYNQSFTIYKNGELQTNGILSGWALSNSGVSDNLYVMSRAGTSLFSEGILCNLTIINKPITDTQTTEINNLLNSYYVVY